MISVPGIGSGLDINTIVSELVAAEGNAKTTLLVSKRTEVSNDISAYGVLKSVLSSFQSSTSSLKDSATFNKRSVSSSDKDFFTATASGTIATGSYDIEVRDLAEAHKLMTPAFTDSSTTVGTGTLSISVGTDTFSVTIDSSNNTVEGIRNAINDASNNTGVSATILNVDDGSGGTETKLVLSSDESGTENAITITVNDDDLGDTDGSGLSQFYYDTSDATTPEQMTQINAATDAEVYIDGQKVLSSSNTVVDAIQGVTIELLKEETGIVNSLTVSLDKNSVSTSVNSFINSYNSMIGAINELSSYDADTNTAGVLLGDASLLSLTGQIRREINATVSGISGSLTNLVEIGITTTATGTLELDSSTLDSVLTSNFDDMDDLFASTDGIATKLDAILTSYVEANGIIDSKISGLNDSVDRIDDDLTDLNESLIDLEERYLAQFSGLDVLLSQLQSTGSFLDQQFSILANIAKK